MVCVALGTISVADDTVTVAGLPVSSIACGSRHTAIISNGKVFTWGDKENGVCGHGDTGEYRWQCIFTCSLEFRWESLTQWHLAFLVGLAAAVIQKGINICQNSLKSLQESTSFS
jgi:hypothetical protein